MAEQSLTLIISGLILIVNGFLFYWLNAVRQDVRDLRKDYLDAVTKALLGNGELKVEIERLNGVINVLRGEVGFLKECLGKEKIQE